MGSGKGGTSEQTTTLQLPPEIEEAAKRNLELARQIGRVGYVSYTGPTVAALTPMQRAAMQNTMNGAQAFGMRTARDTVAPGVDPLTGMTRGSARTVGGVTGFSPVGLYRDAKANISPAQQVNIDRHFTGGAGNAARRKLRGN